MQCLRHKGHILKSFYIHSYITFSFTGINSYLFPYMGLAGAALRIKWCMLSYNRLKLLQVPLMKKRIKRQKTSLNRQGSQYLHYSLSISDPDAKKKCKWWYVHVYSGMLTECSYAARKYEICIFWPDSEAKSLLLIW